MSAAMLTETDVVYDMHHALDTKRSNEATSACNQHFTSLCKSEMFLDLDLKT